MNTRFMTKGKGKGRKVIPLKGKVNRPVPVMELPKVKMLTEDIDEDTTLDAKLNRFIEGKSIKDIAFAVQGNNDNAVMSISVIYTTAIRSPKHPVYKYKFLVDSYKDYSGLTAKANRFGKAHEIVDTELFISSNYRYMPVIMVIKYKDE